MGQINIPDPVIVAEADHTKDNAEPWPSPLMHVLVRVGGIPVMQRTYTSDRGDYRQPPPENFAVDREDAFERALEEFGRKIQALIGEIK